MAESSACLVRSFSTPAEATCCDGNPIRALGESISFGRFMTEGLDWEKWSTFSHNRYVEEAEKYSKPGSVAAKKAYFEAHYKRAAAERAAALIPEANAQANGTFEAQVHEGNCADSSFGTSSNVANVVAANEQLDNETANYQVVECADTDQHKCDAGQSHLDISNVKGAEDVPHPRTDTDLNVESCTFVANSYSNQLHHVEDNTYIAVPAEEKTPDHGAVGQEVLTLSVKGREANSSPKLSTKTVVAKHSRSPDERKAAVLPRSGINSGPKGKKSVGDSVEKKRLIAQSVRMSINLPSGTGETRKRTATASQSRNGTNNFSTSKKSVRGLVEKKRITAPSLRMSINLPSGAGMTSKTDTVAAKPRNGINFAAKSMKSVGNSVEKRPTKRSLHMSINLPSGAGETSKTASVLEQNGIKKNHSNISKNNPGVLRTSTKVSHGLLNQASANPPSQGRRTERPLNKSVSGALTANAKPSSSISFDCLKSSGPTKSNPQSATISTPFRFRSEERAVKRKEFLQRMDETKSKEEEKVKLQRTLKGKTEHDHKKLRQRSGSISKLNEDKPGGSQSPSNQTRKISLTLPQSPKLGRKASSSSSTVQDRSLGNSWKPPISTSKRTAEKNYRTAWRPVTSSSNTTRENASPNIQQ
ncbi:hypothetical protein GLYMA_18G010600v4 [Glycine max]|uniref:Uncharacterized protein n=1 Tax=Glycine max TaxID=3847 RepID=K7MPB2_SOYBN|nr:uncharacterized protein LOC100799349 isoform X2 [Glycine max]KAH1152644.1 hypothetical protein GYH30_048651 [Glycine max]KAH1196393.1 Protein WVD2-like 7 [Glycine max]KRG97480.1 hypothetical protein GLYMA_18G010600v4 [Glycine max]|eukprot:XP_003552792.2 uncharacterized protein LOC100799349 isoform X2 [Glycine max]